VAGVSISPQLETGSRLLSMTGYGRGEGPVGVRRVQVEIRTVNHRFSEMSFRLPRSIAMLENRMRETIQSRISRGKITVNVTIDGIDAPVTRPRLNEEIAASYFEILNELRQRFALSGDLDLGTFLSLPDVLVWESEEITEEAAWSQLEPVLEAAVQDVHAMKMREGENLARDVRERLAAIERALQRIVDRVPGMLQDYQRGMADRLAERKTDPDF